MNSSDQYSDGITRRNFMKNTALTVGAVTLLGQGIGLAAGSSGGGLRWLHVADKRTSSVGRTVTVPHQDPDDIPALYAEALWGMLGNNTEQHEIGRPEEYESTNEVKISTSGAISGQQNGNNTYTVTFESPIEMTKTILKRIAS